MYIAEKRASWCAIYLSQRGQRSGNFDKRAKNNQTLYPDRECAAGVLKLSRCFPGKRQRATARTLAIRL